MGAIFQLRVAYFANLDSYRARYPHPLMLFMTDGEIPLPKATWPTPSGLVFGPENAGLPPEYRSYGQTIRIPQNGAVDSLNLAVAVGVTLYQRQLAQSR